MNRDQSIENEDQFIEQLAKSKDKRKILPNSQINCIVAQHPIDGVRCRPKPIDQSGDSLSPPESFNFTSRPLHSVTLFSSTFAHPATSRGRIISVPTPSTSYQYRLTLSIRYNGRRSSPHHRCRWPPSLRDPACPERVGRVLRYLKTINLQAMFDL